MSRRLRLVLATAALAVVALVTVLVVGRGSGQQATGEPSPGATSTRAEPDDATGRAAADGAAEVVRWVRAELPADRPVLVPDDLRAELGAVDDRFRAGDGDAEGALVLVRGEPPRDAAVLARFEDPDGPELTLVDLAPGEATSDERARRAGLAAAILANPNTGATGRAERVLDEASIDARLLGLLAVLVAQLDVGVADFPPAAGQTTDGPFARHVLIDRVGADPVAPGGPATERLLAFLEAQLPPFAPDTVTLTDEGVLVGFRYVSAPDAVVTDDTP